MRCLHPACICGMGTFKLRNRAQSRPRRDSVWTHIHELPDLLSPALCYSSHVTREARHSRRALLGFRATAPAPPRFERAAFPFSSRFRCVEIRAYSCASNKSQVEAVARAAGLMGVRPSNGFHRRSPARSQGFTAGAPCFSRGSWTCLQQAAFGPAKKQSSSQWASALGISARAARRVPKCPALKRVIRNGSFFRNAEALLPRMNAGAPTEKQVR
jgi:hypothetical protein